MKHAKLPEDQKLPLLLVINIQLPLYKVISLSIYPLQLLEIYFARPELLEELPIYIANRPPILPPDVPCRK
jgi:hypothetical protein